MHANTSVGQQPCCACCKKTLLECTLPWAAWLCPAPCIQCQPQDPARPVHEVLFRKQENEVQSRVTPTPRGMGLSTLRSGDGGATEVLPHTREASATAAAPTAPIGVLWSVTVSWYICMLYFYTLHLSNSDRCRVISSAQNWNAADLSSRTAGDDPHTTHKRPFSKPDIRAVHTERSRRLDELW